MLINLHSRVLALAPVYAYMTAAYTDTQYYLSQQEPSPYHFRYAGKATMHTGA